MDSISVIDEAEPHWQGERTWTSTAGKTFDGRIVGLLDGEFVFLKEDKLVKVKSGQLSKADREFVLKKWVKGDTLWQDMRTWKSATGNTFDGRLVGQVDDECVLLNDVGKFTRVKVRRLSTDDRVFVSKRFGEPGPPVLTDQEIRQMEITAAKNLEREAAKKAEEEMREKAARVVSAQTLMQIYVNNKIKADLILKDTTISVRGVIDEISKDILGKPYITLKTGELIYRVQCYFPKSHELLLADLQKGQTVTVSGTCTGALGHVFLEDCSFGIK